MNPFLVIPAIDLRDGRCVRLLQGDPEKQTVYSEDPAETARSFQSAGARLIHIVDLDGAFSGKPANRNAIEAIRRAVAVSLEVGGGLRSMADLEALEKIGVERFILGSSVITDKAFLKSAVSRFGPRIIAGIDVRDGKIAIKGWKETTSNDLMDVLKELEFEHIREIILTDIRRDGTLTGPGLDNIQKVISETTLELIVSGGISNSQDIRNIRILGNPRIRGVITGKAIYEGKIDLKEIIEELSL